MRNTGYRLEHTEWHRITAFNGLAESVAKGLRKGMKVAVRGRIHNTEWTNAAGDRRFGYEIIAEDITFLSRTRAAAPSPVQTEAATPDSDDVPF